MADSNVLAAIARGVPFTALSKFSEGLDAGRNIAEENRIRNALLEAGRLANQGNYQGAAAAAFGGGDAATGNSLLDFLSQREVAKNLDAYRTQSLGLERERIGLDRERLAYDKGEGNIYDKRAKAAVRYGLVPGTPAHQRYVLEGSLPDVTKTGNVEGEVAARIGLGQRFLDRIPDIEKRLDATFGDATGYDVNQRTELYFNAGEAGAIKRDIQSGADALRRMLTGAGMNPGEADEYANRYSIGPLDKYETMKQKVANLKGDLEYTRNAVAAGKKISLDQLAGGNAASGGTTGKLPYPENDNDGGKLTRDKWDEFTREEQEFWMSGK